MHEAVRRTRDEIHYVRYIRVSVLPDGSFIRSSNRMFVSEISAKDPELVYKDITKWPECAEFMDLRLRFVECITGICTSGCPLICFQKDLDFNSCIAFYVKLSSTISLQAL